MGENRDKSYPIRMSIEEIRITKELAKKVKLPDMLREYIKELHDNYVDKTTSGS